MARKKDVEALFEVITKSKSGGKDMPGLTIPEWMRKPVSSQSQPQDPTPSISDEPSDDSDLPPLELPPPRAVSAPRAAPAGPAATPRPATVAATPPPIQTAAPAPAAAPATVPVLPAAQPAAVPAAVATAPPARPAPRRPLRMPEMFTRKSSEHGPAGQSGMAGVLPVVKIENQQMSVVLNPASAAVTAGAIVALMVGMFVIGWASKRTAAPAVENVQPARTAEPAAQPPAQERAAATPPARTAGKYYMIIQGLGGKSAEDLQEAWRIQKFCTEANYPVTVSLLQGQYVIYSMTGFDNADEPSAKAYAEKIKELGKQYKTQTQGREFKQTDPRGRWPWFLKYSGPGPVAG
ncbi:MAG: hypothetical protein LLG01_17095 [Planctomycetaceae bacterium]|nr:hypothetical protein [Planctomycetaceae bacterium]